MSYRLIVRQLAEADLAEAQDWYEDQRPGLGSEFRATIDGLLQRIAENPFAYPAVHRDTRRAVVRRFPYLLYFSVSSETVTILACLHGRRHPSRIRSRLGGD